MLQWQKHKLSLTPTGSEDSYPGTWTLAHNPKPGSDLASAMVGPSLGDIDLDGLPDLLVGLQFEPSDGGPVITVPVVLMNQNENGFQANLLPRVNAVDTTLNQVAFFDHNEDVSVK